MAWARAYADRNRRVIAARVEAILGEQLGIAAEPTTWCSCDHNHVQREVHDGEPLWVHRKARSRRRGTSPA